VVLPFDVFLIFVFPVVVSMVILGSNPMKEYLASFFGPSMDSKRYVVECFCWSFWKISRGWDVILICLIFRGLTGVVGFWLPKAIPHFACAPV
jgi:hypothetical protein